MSLHLMIDLETLDTVSTSKILSLGVVVFTAEGTVRNRYYGEPSLTGQENRTLSDSTLRWWLSQGKEARSTLAQDVARGDLPHCLRMIDRMLSKEEWKTAKVWANGASFDTPMLEHAYVQAGMPVPWKHWNSRCYRTIKNMFRDVKEDDRQGVFHNALDDAMHQMQHLLKIHRHSPVL